MSNLLVADGVGDSVLELWNSAAKTTIFREKGRT
jgi:hypothetical protein